MGSRIQFWKREFGSLWIPDERERILEFSKIKPDERVNVNGYVKWINNRAFALVPTLFSYQKYLLCINNTNIRPPENSYVTVSGSCRRFGLRQMNKSSRVFDADLIVDVYDWEPSKPYFRIPKDDTHFEDFKNNLTCRIEGLEPQIEDFLAFTTISTPSLGEFSGGVNATLYDSTKSGIPKKVIREIQTAIPKGMGNLFPVSTPLGTFALRYQYNFFVGDADKPLSNVAEKFLTHKVSGFDEASLSLFSKNDKPLSLEDPPCSLSDIPTVTPETTTIVRGKSIIDQYDALRYLMISHLKTPIIQDFDKSIDVIVSKLEELTERWGLPDGQISNHGFLDANYNAKPQSVLRQCLAFARAKNVDLVTVDFVSQGFEDYFKWNLEYVNELWEDLISQPLVGKQTMVSLRVKYREVIRIIRKHYSSKDVGVKKETILSETDLPPLKMEKLLEDCKRDAVIYEPRVGFYKLTRDYD